MGALAKAVARREHDVIQRWSERVRLALGARELPAAELVDSLPRLLQELVAALRRGDEGWAIPCEIGTQHGLQRFRVGVDFSQLLGEYDALFDVVLGVAAEEGVQPDLREVRVLTRYVSACVTCACEHYAAERDRAAREATSWFETLFEAVPVGLAILDRDLRYVRINRTLADLNGIPPERTVGRTARDIIPEVAEALDAVVRRVFETGRAAMELEMTSPQTAERQERHWLVGFAPLPAGEAPRLVAAVVVDITDRKRSERLAEEARAFERHLIGIVSHDLKSPLAAIHLSTQTLLRRRRDDPDSAPLERIRSAADRANRLVRDLLDFTQARLGGGLPLQRGRADLAALARAAAEEVQPQWPDRAISVEVRGDTAGDWDADRMSQVLANLLTNAMKYGDPGTPVRVVVDGGQDPLLVEVHNEGAPIPPETVDELFEPLRRGRAPEQLDRSVGLGLYIVREVVRAHGGTVEVTSGAGTGTDFRVRLPRGDYSVG